MKSPQLIIAFCGALCFPSAGVFAGDEIGGAGDPLPVLEPLLDPEPRIAVMPTEVSLDGIEQPALGRSLSDSLIGGLVAQGRARVISYEEAQKELAPAEDGGKSPDALAGMLGRRLGAQKILVPRLVGEDEFYRFTVKEVDTGNYEVSRVFELSHVGDREGIFGFVPLVLSELEKDGKQEKSRKGAARNPVIKIWSWEEYRRDFGYGEDPAAGFPPKALPVDRPEVPGETAVGEREAKRASPPGAGVEAGLARARGRHVAEMVALGKITSVNPSWGFCVIDMTGRKLKPSEEVEIREGETDAVYATLVVTRVEGDKAIADLAKGDTAKRPLPGDVVYGWAIR